MVTLATLYNDFKTLIKQNFYDKDEVDDALSDKQDSLVSGTNIKTVNNNSLLGSGNISISGSGTVDSSLSTTSTNPVQNQAITNEINSLNNSITNLEYDTDWQTLTIAHTSFAHYSTGAELKARRIGRVVELNGQIKNTNTITLNATNVTIATLSSEFRPSIGLIGVMQGSGTNIFNCTVNPNGTIQLSRYRANTTTYPSINAGAWFPIHLIWIV